MFEIVIKHFQQIWFVSQYHVCFVYGQYSIGRRES